MRGLGRPVDRGICGHERPPPVPAFVTTIHNWCPAQHSPDLKIVSRTVPPPPNQIKIRAGALDGIDHWDYLVNAETAAASGSPRQEMVYNFDPYILWTDDDDDE